MKKIRLFLLLIILTFLCILGININASENSLIPNNYIEDNQNDMVFEYHNGCSFNYIGDNYLLDKNDYINDLKNCLPNHNYNGKYVIKSNIDVYTNNRIYEHVLKIIIYISNSSINHIDYYLENEMYYYLPINNNDEYKEFKGLDLYDYYNEYARAQVQSTSFDNSNVTCDDPNNLQYLNIFLNYYYKNMIFVNYELDETNNYFTLSSDYLCSSEEIISQLGLIYKNKKIDNCEIIGGNYNPNINNPGKYNLIIRGLLDNIIVIKRIIIKIIDNYNPIENKEIITTYYNKLTKEDIINSINISTDYDELEFETNYFDNDNITGEYYFVIKIYTNNGTYKKKNKIKVVDDIPPTIEGPDYLITDTEHRLIYDEILKYYTFNDDYNNDNLFKEVIELNEDYKYDYNYNYPGTFYLRISCVDNSGISNYKDIILYVNEYVNPNPPITSSTNVESSNISSSNSSSTNTNPPTTSSTPTSSTTNIIPPITSSSTIPISSTTSITNPTSTTTSVIPTTSYTTPTISSTTIPTKTTMSQMSSTTTPSTTSTSTTSTIPIPLTSSSTTPTTSLTIVPTTTTPIISSTFIPSSSSIISTIPITQTTTNQTSIITSNTTNIIPTTTITNIPISSSTNIIPSTTTSKSTELPSNSFVNTSTNISPTIASTIIDITTTKQTDSSVITTNPSINHTTNNIIPSLTSNDNIDISNSSSEIVSTNIETSNTITTSIIKDDKTKNDNFSLSVKSNEELSINKIKYYLLDSGLIDMDEYNDIIIESEYFNNKDKSGTYDLIIKHKNGESSIYQINVLKQENTILKTNNIIALIIASSVILITLIIVIILVIRRRKNA